MGSGSTTDLSFRDGPGVARAAGVSHDRPDRRLVRVVGHGGSLGLLRLVLAVPLLINVGDNDALQDESGGFGGLKGGGGEVDAVPEGYLV
eukprot:6450643-Pyramimonas_sp.AAC.1